MRSLADWLQYQQQTHPRAVDLSLERIVSVAQRLDLITQHAPVATVGGTNGKGSTATTLACLLKACERRVGLFTSPHLVRYNERIRIDGIAASDAELVGAFERIEAARADVTLTFFEFNTLAALDLFRRHQVDVMVLEVGLGGRLDATNILDADVAVLCSIGFDHREWLGDTLELIGAEKAGIFRHRQKVVLGTQQMPASVWRRLKELDCEVWTAQRQFNWELQDEAAAQSSWDYRAGRCELTDLPAPNLTGSIQYRNAASALTALQLMTAQGCQRARIAKGLMDVALPGRFQIIPGEVEWILDVAHNQPAAGVLAQALAARAQPGRTYAVAGMLADKDAAAIALALNMFVDRWLLVDIVDEPRALSAAALKRRLPPLRGEVELCGDVGLGCARARELAQPGDRVVVLGSFHVVGPALTWLGLY